MTRRPIDPASRIMGDADAVFRQIEGRKPLHETRHERIGSPLARFTVTDAIVVLLVAFAIGAMVALV